MPFSIPQVDQLGWGEPLQKHLAQLNDPSTGGLIHVANVAERDSKFWPNGATDKDEYANKTVYVTATGTFHVWTISTDSANTRYWRELQKTLSSQGWVVQPGTIEGYGFELVGTGTFFSRLKKGDQVRVGTSIHTIDNIISNTRLRLTGTAAYAWVTGGSANGNWPDFPNFKVVSVVGNVVTFNGPVSTIGARIGDLFRFMYSVDTDPQKNVILNISGNSLTVNTTAFNGYSYPFWVLERVHLPNSTFSSQPPLQIWSDGEVDRFTINPNGQLTNIGPGLTLVPTLTGSTSGSYLTLNSVSGLGSYLNNRDLNVSSSMNFGLNPSNKIGVNAGDCLLDTSPNTPIRFYTHSGDIVFQSRWVSWAVSDLIIKTNLSETAGGQGLIGMGTDSPTQKLHVIGNILATGTITPGSDRRWKENIVKIDSALEKISLLEGVTYNWKDKEEKGEERQIGLIAQDVEKAFPEAIKKDNEGYMSLNYDGLVGALVEGIKELKDIIQTLNERIAVLENK